MEGFQAGLSWQIVLNKRENFRKAFDYFEVEKVAKYDEEKVVELINDAGIIRNKASGTTVRHTSPSAILSVDMPLPPLTEQARIVNMLSSFDNVLQSAQILQIKHRQLKSGLLKDLLTGKVRVLV